MKTVINYEIYKGGKHLITLGETKETPPTKEEFRNRFSPWGKKGVKIPCPNCEGTSTIYDPNDPPCPVEGNKMRDIIPCPDCKGTGEGDPKEFELLWKAEVQRIKNKPKEFKAYVEKMKNICDKLTIDEIQFIRNGFNDMCFGARNYRASYFSPPTHTKKIKWK